MLIKRHLLFSAFFILIFAGFALSSDRPLISAKDNPVIPSSYRAFLSGKPMTEKVSVWVYFTDKGVFDQATYAKDLKIAENLLTSKSLQRRAKITNGELTSFIDLPVNRSYIENVKDLGADLRQISRWLNAASFEVSIDKLNLISSLPFVKSIQPVRTFIRQPLKEEIQPELKPVGSVDYGPSYDQLQQINVPAVHALGYRGQGVLVCMMDTGFRKDHIAFKNAFLEGRVLAEYDFINHDTNTQNEPGQDATTQHNHGTYTWSTLGGEIDGELYGPAYKANFILAKTEYVPTETRIEEDNWVAGMEWADSLGADVISSSLGYLDFDNGFTYTKQQLDGKTAVTTIAANTATRLGIIVCNAMGNEGPGDTTLITPADAETILACGAVNSSGVIASWSSRGPTGDGRIKPEVVARGYATYCATAGDTNTFGYVSGTSLSTPLVGGCAAVLLSAHPDWVPWKVREALMYTANNSSTPNNTYGWGLINLLAAIQYSFGTGDVNRNGSVTVSDAVYLVNYLFKGGPPPYLLYRGDVNCDQSVTVGDIVYLINYLFKGGPSPGSY
ncbi:MAG TPA: S8 family serine peptidase [Terriglobales bacterium]|nr:S8 family serine peptidase [Terriglobales bacterium]